MITMSSLWLVAMHTGDGHAEQAGAPMALLVLGLVALVIAATLVLRTRRSRRDA